MDRKEFMRDVYSNYWIDARDAKYGFMEYDRHLCGLLTEGLPEGGKLLEVAIGTGFPIADFLAKAGYSVGGIDISPALIERCKQVNADIDARVGDAENLDYPDASFDGVYCFHATWYFPSLPRVIDEMFRVAKPGALIMFDIQNRANPEISSAYQRRLDAIAPGLANRANLHARNLAKVVLRRGNPNWHAVNYEVPTDPIEVAELLAAKAPKEFAVLGREESSQALTRLPGAGAHATYPRLVFSAIK